MRVMIVADTEEPGLWDYYSPKKTEGVELILSCGDLHPDYMEFLTTVVNVPLLYVRGNHDGIYDRKPPEGCIDIDDQVYNYHGMRILGLGGSYRYKPGGDMYTEAEMMKRVRKLTGTLLFTGGFDILLTHAPALGYGDLGDLPHRGFDVFNDLLEKYKPAYMFHGHVHREYGDFTRTRNHSCGTVITNGYGHVIIDIPESAYPKEGETGSFFYDWYITGKNRRR